MSLQNLQEVALTRCSLGDVNFRRFLEALEDSGCAGRMVDLTIYICDIGLEGARSLAGLLHRDGLPALEKLCLSENEMQDEGVVALAGALCEAPRTGLLELESADVGLRDEGMAALASLMHRGRMGRTRNIYLSEASGVTDKGIVALARAIDEGGLAKLQQLDLGASPIKKVTALGFGAMFHAFIKGCPEATEIHMTCPAGKDHALIEKMVKGMLQAAGRTVLWRKHWMDDGRFARDA